MAVLGISAHKITQSHTQSYAPLNSGWLFDPVSTVAMSAVVGGGDITEAVQQEIKSGAGAQLRQYYQYGSRRFRKRNLKSEVSIVNANGELTNVSSQTLDKYDPNVEGKFSVVLQEWGEYSLSGAKFYSDMNEKYGLNSFTETEADGTNIVITTLQDATLVLKHSSSLGTSWVIGRETKQNIPVVILDPSIDKANILEPVHILAQDLYEPVPSKGVVYWYSTQSTFTERERTNKVGVSYNYSDKNLGLWGYAVNKETEGNRRWYTITNTGTEDPMIDENYTWEDPRINKSSTTSLKDLQESSGAFELMSEPILYVTKNYVNIPDQSTEETNDEIPEARYFKGYTYNIIGSITFDSEGYIWVTADDNTNTPGAEELYSDKKTADTKKLLNHEGTDSWFKWFPYTPITERGHHYADTSKLPEYIKALQDYSNATKNAEATEVDSPKRNSEYQRKSSKEINKLNISDKTENILKRKTLHLRKMEIREANDITKSDLRHLNQLGKLAGTDWAELAAQDDSDETDNYFSAIVPSVPLGSNADEVNEYWWDFWNRVYSKMGAAVNQQFESAVNSIPTTELDISTAINLPITRISWKGFQSDGYLGFTQIHKFRMKGRIRKTERKRRLKEVRAGKLLPLYILQGEDLRYALLNPVRELIPDEYFTSKSGKEYNIGLALNKVEESVVRDFTSTLDSSYHTMKPTIGLGGAILFNNPVFTDGQAWSQGSNASSDEVDYLISSSSGYGWTINADDSLGFKLNTGMGQERHAAQLYGDTRRLLYLSLSLYGYTFFCKPVGDSDEIDVIAVAGLVGATRSSLGSNHESSNLDGAYIGARAYYELALFHYQNRSQYKDKKLPNDSILLTTFSEGGGKYHVASNIQSFFVVPLEYRTYSRLGGVTALKLASRAVSQVAWNRTRQRGYRDWVAPVIQGIGFIVTGIVTIFSFGAGTQPVVAGFSAALTAVAEAVAVQLIVSYGLKQLVRIFGLKGLMLLIAAVVAMAVARNTSAFGALFKSLPLASQTTVNQVATTATKEVLSNASKTLIEQLGTALQSTLQQSLSSFVNASSKQILLDTMGQLNTLIQAGVKYNTENQQELQEQMSQEQDSYREAMVELNDLKEEFESQQAPFDVTRVLLESRAVSPIDMETFLGYYTMTDNTLASLEYLSGFLDQRLAVEPDFFDIDDSVTFSLGKSK